MKGVDLDVQWLASATDLLSLKALFLDSKYHDLRYTIAALSTTSCPATGVVVGAFPVIDCSGHSVMRAPRWSLNADYAHTFRLDGGATLRGHVGSHYQTETSVALNFRPPADVQGAYHMSQADLTFQAASGSWSVSGWVRNIEDKAVAVSAQFPPGTSATAPGGAVYAVDVLQPPRTYGATLTVHFGGG
jgi:iron complex outermembrane receptor protein